MYSSLIIEARLRSAVKAGLTYTRLPRTTSIGRAAEIEALRKDDAGKLLPENQLRRQLKKDELAFIASEQLICKVDFEYFFTRYANLELDPGVTEDGKGGIAAPILAESQRHYVKLLAAREEECHRELKAYGFTLGIIALFHKTRQVMATATARAMTWHRMLFWQGTRAFCATLDDPRKGELFKRDHVILDNLPWFLAPRVYPDVKDTEIGLESPISSRLSYQAENQTTGIGTGSQNDVSHLTEVALWKYPGRIKYSFVPSIPKAITTLHVQESTADGKGNYWHEVTEAARHKRRGYEHYVYAFVPWYMNTRKYRSIPPGNWVPEPNTIRHAELIERTSPEFMSGVSYRPTVEQLYWYESERANHIRTGELASFKTNFPATPEESFQNPSQGALPVELLEQMEQEVRGGVCYEVEVIA
jgi:hypothetical protein